MRHAASIAALGAALAGSVDTVEASVFNFSWSEAYTVEPTWTQESNPKPIFDYPSQYTLVAVADWSSTGTLAIGPYSALYFRTAAYGGGFYTPDNAYSLTGPQMFTGSVSDPVFQTGSFTLYDVTTSQTASLSVASAPEPATWALMGAGLAALSLAGVRPRAPRALAL